MSKYKVLAVDDEKDFLKILSYKLEKSDYEIITASDGKECIDKARRFSPDIIILDIMMPGLDGIATLLKLKSIKETKSKPVIISTAVKEGEDEIVARNLGVADYFKKTNPIEELIIKIEKILKK